jgi:hypothetical protein
MSTRFPRRLPPPRYIQLINVTFLPSTVALLMRDEDERVFIWSRKDSPLILDQETFRELVKAARSQPPGKVNTVTLDESFELLSEEEAFGYTPSLARYIKRGTVPEEEPMLIVAYGILNGAANDYLREALAEVLAVAA